MKIISFLNHKGGVGKTTLCTNIAQAFVVAERPQTLMLVDADPQGSLRDWYDALEPGIKIDGIEVVGADKRNTLSGLTDFIDADFMFIDTPGDIKEIHGVALQMSDMVIIPIRPSPYDVWATEDTIDLVRTAKSLNKKLQAVILINQAIPNSRIHKEVGDLLQKYDDFYITKRAICHRLAFAKTASLGGTVYDSSDSYAMNEVTDVANELIDLLFWEYIKMSINPRNRTYSNTDLLRAKEAALKPKMHKICLNVPKEEFKKLKKKAVDEDLSVTDIVIDMIREYIK